MKNRFLAGVLWALLLPLTSLSGYVAYNAVTQETVVAERDSVFLVESGLIFHPHPLGGGVWGQHFGSAFLVNRGENGVGLITAWHVVQECQMPVAVHGPTESLSVTFERIGAADLAWVSLDAWPGSWKVLAAAHINIGQKVRCIGFPDAEMLEATTGIIRVRQLEKINGLMHDDGDYWCMDADVIPGMSGGPVLDADGAVVAVVVIHARSGKVRSMAVELPH